MNKYISKGTIIGIVWGLVSIFGAISGMIHMSGKQSSVSGSWGLDAILFLPAFLGWQLTKIFPESAGMGIVVLFSPLIIGACIGKTAGCLYGKFKK